MLHKIADNLEISKFENKERTGEETDRFAEKVRELVENIYEQLKENLEGQQGENRQFFNAIIRIFTILLNTKTRSITKIKKIIKTSANLVLELWPEQNSLLGD